MAFSTPTRGYGFLEAFLARQRSRMAERLIPVELREGRLLDIGCSVDPCFLSSAGFREKYGIDKLIEPGHAQKFAAQNILLRRYDIESGEPLPFESDFFAVVTMLAVFEHLDPLKLAGILSGIRRVIRPGGRLVLTTPAAWTDSLLRTMARLHLVSPEEIGEHKDAYTFRKIAALLEQAGFPAPGFRFGYFELHMNIWAIAVK
jgi:SAM-dependent methyltransferase